MKFTFGHALAILGVAVLANIIANAITARMRIGSPARVLTFPTAASTPCGCKGTTA